FFSFFFQAEDGIRDRNVTGVQTCALPISQLVVVAQLVAVVSEQVGDVERHQRGSRIRARAGRIEDSVWKRRRGNAVDDGVPAVRDRKSTRLNSSHVSISYAVFCLKKKTIA